MRVALGALLGILVLGASPAHAYLLEPEHDGFYLRLQTGPGLLDVRDDDFSMGGLAGTIGLAVGGTLAKNLVLHGEFIHQTALDTRFHGFSMRRSGEDEVTFYGFGPGVTYYFMPLNLYLSGSVLLSWVSQSTPIADGTSDPALGLRASIGKEWWVSRHWGLGLALVGNLANVSDRGTSLSAKGISLAFSATLN